METPGDEAMFVFERGRGRRDERDDEDDDCDDQGDDDGLLFFFSRRRKNESQGSLLLSLFRSCFKTSLAAPLRTERQKTMTRILRSWDGRERSAGSNEVAARSSHQKNACSSRRLSMASASTPFALTPPGLCFPSPCSPGRQTTCTRHERARDKNKRRSPRGYAETVKSWRVWSFLFPHGDETPTRSLPLPFFRLLSSSPASPPSPHLPSFLQPTKQVSFPLLFLGVEPCAAGRGGKVLERRGKRRSIEEALEGPARRFHGGGALEISAPCRNLPVLFAMLFALSFWFPSMSSRVRH